MNNQAPLRVAVVSIGRSGTSLFARILHDVLGVDFGDVADHIPANHNNPDGYFENAAIMAFNDRILQNVNGWVLSPPPLDCYQHMSPDSYQALVSEAAQLLGKFSANKPAFGWKDPRLSLTLPIWRAACPTLTPIICFRQPLSVLSSIGAQLDKPVESLTGLWRAYYQRVFAYSHGMKSLVVSFDDLLVNPTPVVMQMAQHLHIAVDEAAVSVKLSEIVKPQQSRHSSVKNASNSAPIIDFRTLSLYEYLRDTVRAGEQPAAEKLAALLAD